MNKALDISHLRLHNQHITQSKFKKIGDLVAHMGAIQAQDYLGGLWAIASRLNVSEKDVEAAISRGEIIRTWPMRGTLHFVASKDIRWMVELMTPRVVANARNRAHSMGLTDKVIAKAKSLFIKNLTGGKQVTRKELLQILEDSKINTKEYRGGHIIGRLSQESIICIGPRQGKEQTFVLLDEWAPHAKSLSREESLKEITYRYFNSHGPATIEDMGWWSGLRMSEIKEGLEMNKSRLISESFNSRTFWMSKGIKNIDTKPSLFLLASFEEYLVGYKNRQEVLSSKFSPFINPGGNGMFSPIIVSDGQVIGTWKRTIKKDRVIIKIDTFRSLSKSEKEDLKKEVERYGKFIGLKTEI